MANDGIANELRIVNAYNSKRYSDLSDDQKIIIDYLNDSGETYTVIKAEKIRGDYRRNYKPDVKFVIEDNNYYVSVKKGTGNSVHQEPTETFIRYCQDYLDMNDYQKECMLYFLYGDGTIDGTGEISNRVGDEELKRLYANEIQVVNDFFSHHSKELIDRFVISGRYGREVGLLAEYLYHGTEEKGSICILNDDVVSYLASIKKENTDGVTIGPFNFQAYGRNLKNKPSEEKRRHSIQIKCGFKFEQLIDKVNNYINESKALNITSDYSTTHVVGNNIHGFKNQEYLALALNGNKYNMLNSNLRLLLRTMYPAIKNTDVIIAEQILNQKIKPRLEVTVNNTTHFISVKMGKGNSVHQEKLETFIDCCKELGMTDYEEMTLKKFIFGDGTIDGTGDINDRCDEGEIIKRLGKSFNDLQRFLNRNKVVLAKRFLMEGIYNEVSSEYIYYGTEKNGITVSYIDVLNYIEEYSVDDPEHLCVGPLHIQTWNRNLPKDGKKWIAASDYKRNSIQVKWKTLEFDLEEIMLKSLSNIGSNYGTISEYDLVSLLNRTKNRNHVLWKQLCNTLHLENIKNIYAVKVTDRVYSNLSEQYVLPKSDIYLIEANLDESVLLACNYWLDEEVLKEVNYNPIPLSGISVKHPTSKDFTYAKFSISSFIKLFKNKYVGASISLFVKESDLQHNEEIINRWSISREDFKYYIENEMNIHMPHDFLEKSDYSKIIKRWGIDYLKKDISNDSYKKEVIFLGKHIYEEPYCANFIYSNGLINKYVMPNFSVTTGSGRHKGNITIVIKP